MKKSIVIVDDDTTILKSLVDFFTKKEYEVFGATGAIKGLEYIYEKKPSAILLDIMMPEMNGIDVLKDLEKTDKALLEIVTIMTNTPDMEYLSEALEHGVSNYLIKSDMSLEKIFEKVDSRV